MRFQDFSWEARSGTPVPSWQAEYDKHTLRTTHQLKSPLDTIRGNISLVLDGFVGPISEEARVLLKRTDERARGMAQMVLDMQHLARLEARAPDPGQFVMTAIDPMVRTCIEELRPSADRRHIELQLALEPLSFLCIPEHLRLLFQNLLTNAFTYSHDKGQVQISCGQDSATSQGVVAIADRGIGIPAEALARVFDGHFRTKEAVKHNPSATGVGLAIVKRVAQDHRLHLRVASELGQGTTFTVLFPVAGVREAVEPHGREAPASKSVDKQDSCHYKDTAISLSTEDHRSNATDHGQRPDDSSSSG